VGVAGPEESPGGGEPPRRETPWDHAPQERQAGEGDPQGRHEPPPRGLSTRNKIIAGIVVGAFYAASMTINGHLVPGLIGGALGGVVCFLVLREVEAQRARKRS
jgi:hypothetical protein